jgi:hypothetical protein
MNTAGTYNQNKGIYAFILFLIWPLLSVISALQNYREPWAKNIIWIFTAFYGFCYAIGAENDSADIVRYISSYQSLYGVSISFVGFFVYLAESGQIDILKNVIALILSRFTDSQVALTTIYGVIFGYFLSRNIWYLLDRLEGKLKLTTILLLACFFLVNPIWFITGFRMWTAGHIFIFGLLPFLFEGKKSGLWISAASILVHFSFIVPVGILLAYVFMGNRALIYFSFFVATFFISEIDIAAFNQIVESYAPEIVQEETAGYRNEQYVEQYREGESRQQLNWYVLWYGKAIKWSIVGFLVMLFIKGKKALESNRGLMSLYSFTLLFYGVCNLLSSLPSGGRFLNIANLCALAVVILYIQNREQEVAMERFVWLVTPALMLYILVAIRIGIYSISATAILGNPLIAFFLSGDHLSLNDVMRKFI